MRPGSTAYCPATKAGHGGLGEDPVGDADARVGGLQHRGLMQVDPRLGEHLVGHLAQNRGGHSPETTFVGRWVIETAAAPAP
jgi:hypothetical protein